MLDGIFDALTQLKRPEFIAAVAAVLVALRAVSEALLAISRLTENTTDDKLARGFAEFVRKLGRLLGWFGIGNQKLSRR